MHVCMNLHVCACVFVFIHTYTCAHACVHVDLTAYLCTCVHVCSKYLASAMKQVTQPEVVV